jgi:hypothetical protein
MTDVPVGSYCLGSTSLEILTPDNLPCFANRAYMHEPTDFDTVPFRRPSFDCSIPQLLSSAPYIQELPATTNSEDTTILAQPLFQSTSPDVNIKTEGHEDSLGEQPVSDLIPQQQTALVMANPEPQYVDPQITFANFIRIPQALSMVTSPLLERNPAFRHLYHHFIRDTCRVLVPHDDEHNPFRTILAQMALHPSAEHLLAALLASSASHRAGMKGENPPKYLISNLLQTTLEGLRKALDDPTEASRDTSLATAIALSSYNIISSDVSHWRMHLGGAREIILHHRRMATRPLHESSVRTFLFKWFAYLDVIAGVSGLTLKEHNYESAVSLIEDVTEHPRPEPWEPSKFDTFSGFTSRLLPLLLRIGKLAHEKRTAESANIDLSQDGEFLLRVDTLEFDLNADELDIIVIPTEHTIDAELEYQLRACNEAFHSAARLHIQRRLRNLSSEQVSHTVEKVFRAIEKVPVGSGPEICLLYPLFSAGVEATGNYRHYAQYRMTEMEKNGIGNVQRAKKVMLATWEQTDINGSVQWEDVLERMGWDLSLA